MNTNGTHATSEPAARPGERVIEFNENMKAALADHEYIHEEYNRGTWAPYAGHFIAVVDRQLRGHADDPRELRARVANELGVPPGRVAVSYVECPEDLYI
jgi:hypothetical protein